MLNEIFLLFFSCFSLTSLTLAFVDIKEMRWWRIIRAENLFSRGNSWRKQTRRLKDSRPLLTQHIHVVRLKLLSSLKAMPTQPRDSWRSDRMQYNSSACFTRSQEDFWQPEVEEKETWHSKRTVSRGHGRQKVSLFLSLCCILLWNWGPGTTGGCKQHTFTHLMSSSLDDERIKSFLDQRIRSHSYVEESINQDCLSLLNGLNVWPTVCVWFTQTLTVRHTQSW